MEGPREAGAFVFSAGCYRAVCHPYLLSSEQGVEVCDATKLNAAQVPGSTSQKNLTG